ncbi:hypothetical protein LINPERHAP1_LOCUS27313 [Linum perenne]
MTVWHTFSISSAQAIGRAAPSSAGGGSASTGRDATVSRSMRIRRSCLPCRRSSRGLNPSPSSPSAAIGSRSAWMTMLLS